MTPKVRWKMIKVTDIQIGVLHRLADGTRLTHPRGSLERLAKKGLVEGDRRSGWAITPRGRAAIGGVPIRAALHGGHPSE